MDSLVFGLNNYGIFDFTPIFLQIIPKVNDCSFRFFSVTCKLITPDDCWLQPKLSISLISFFAEMTSDGPKRLVVLFGLYRPVVCFGGVDFRRGVVTVDF